MILAVGSARYAVQYAGLTAHEDCRDEGIEAAYQWLKARPGDTVGAELAAMAAATGGWHNSDGVRFDIAVLGENQQPSEGSSK